MILSMADTGKVNIHEGNRIRALLGEIEKRPADLARAADVTQTSAGRWLDAERLGAKAWETASRGLLALGIDPRKVRPSASVPLRLRENADELRALLHGFSRKQLEALKQILDSTPEAQLVLKIVIQDRLEQSRAG